MSIELSLVAIEVAVYYWLLAKFLGQDLVKNLEVAGGSLVGVSFPFVLFERNFEEELVHFYQI